jgi:hypothetical protein
MSRFSLTKKDLKIAKFRLRCTPRHFFKKCRFLTMIFIGYRQLNNIYFYLPITTHASFA